MKEFEILTDKILEQKDYVYETFFCHFSTFKNLPVYHYRIPKGQSFYRARKNDFFKNFSEFSDLSSPPKDMVLNYNRANKPKQSVLYVSDSWLTNIAELKLFWLDELTIGDVFWVTQVQFELLDDIKVIIIPDLNNAQMNKFVSKNSAKEEIEFLSFVNKYFLTPIKPNEIDSPIYEFTSAFSNSLRAETIRSKSLVDGILYTSVVYQKGFNLALNSDLIKNKRIRIKNVLKHYLRKSAINEIENSIQPINAKIIDYENNKIIWEE